MSAHVQVYNPVMNQKVNKQKLNVMGRVITKGVQNLGVYLNNYLIRRVKPSVTGAFECHLDLSELPEGEHLIEIRAIIKHSTHRMRVPFKRVIDASVNQNDAEDPAPDQEVTEADEPEASS